MGYFRRHVRVEFQFQFHATDGNHIPRLERHFLNWRTIDERSVAASEIEHSNLAVSETDLSMPPRCACRFEHHVGVGCPPDAKTAATTNAKLSRAAALRYQAVAYWAVAYCEPEARGAILPHAGVLLLAKVRQSSTWTIGLENLEVKESGRRVPP